MQSSKWYYKYSWDKTDARELEAGEEHLEANNDICGAEEARKQDYIEFLLRRWVQINTGSEYAALTKEVRRSFHHRGSRGAVQVAAGKAELCTNKN